MNKIILEIWPLLVFLILWGLLIVARFLGLFNGIQQAAARSSARRLRRKGRIYIPADAIEVTRARIPASLSQRLSDEQLTRLFEARDSLVNSNMFRRFGSSGDLERLANAMITRGIPLTPDEVGIILDAESHYVIGKKPQ